jgi:predicted acylesterase/phospholipase RssA
MRAPICLATWEIRSIAGALALESGTMDVRSGRRIRRLDFVAALAGTPILLGTSTPPVRGTRFGRALVLAGGGARGAYEAGIIEALRAAAGVSDGEPIPGIDVVCGTSIGALNGWFAATAQYSRLADLWHGVAAERVIVLKRRFAATTKPDAPILTKIVQALSLARGLTTNVQGILDSGSVARWIAKHVDAQRPVVVPFCFTVTNLDKARAELLLRLPFVPTSAERTTAVERLRHSVGSNVTVDLVPDDNLHASLRASATIPVLFDPVVMTSPEGDSDRYIDGGVSDNDPIDVGRALAGAVNMVFVDPVSTERLAYDSALSIGVGAFGVAQARILAASLRAAYLETRGKRLFLASATTDEQKRFLETVLDVDLSVMRPLTDLPVQTVEFDRQDKIDAAYQQGMKDVARGWVPYAPS